MDFSSATTMVDASKWVLLCAEFQAMFNSAPPLIVAPNALNWSADGGDANAKLLNVSILFLDNMVLMALLGSTRLQCASKAALESVIAITPGAQATPDFNKSECTVVMPETKCTCTKLDWTSEEFSYQLHQGKSLIVQLALCFA